MRGRNRRQDEIGTRFCVTVDFDTLDDQAVTVRERDGMTQERIAIDGQIPMPEQIAEWREQRGDGGVAFVHRDGELVIDVDNPGNAVDFSASRASIAKRRGELRFPSSALCQHLEDYASGHSAFCHRQLPVSVMLKTTGNTSNSSGCPGLPVDICGGPTSPALTTAACSTPHWLPESSGEPTH